MSQRSKQLSNYVVDEDEAEDEVINEKDYIKYQGVPSQSSNQKAGEVTSKENTVATNSNPLIADETETVTMRSRKSSMAAMQEHKTLTQIINRGKSTPSKESQTSPF